MRSCELAVNCSAIGLASSAGGRLADHLGLSGTAEAGSFPRLVSGALCLLLFRFLSPSALHSALFGRAVAIHMVTISQSRSLDSQRTPCPRQSNDCHLVIGSTVQKGRFRALKLGISASNTYIKEPARHGGRGLRTGAQELAVCGSRLWEDRVT